MNCLGEKGFFSGEKGPIIWQSRFTFVLLQVAFYVKARLCRSQPHKASLRPRLPVAWWE